MTPRPVSDLWTYRKEFLESLRMGRRRGPDHYEFAVHVPTDLWPGDVRWRGEEAKKVEQDIRRIGFYNGCRMRAIQKHDIVRTIVSAFIALC